MKGWHIEEQMKDVFLEGRGAFPALIPLGSLSSPLLGHCDCLCAPCRSSAWFPSPLMLNNVGLSDRLALFSLQRKWFSSTEPRFVYWTFGNAGIQFAPDGAQEWDVVRWHRCVANQSRFFLCVFPVPVRPLCLRQDGEGHRVKCSSAQTVWRPWKALWEVGWHTALKSHTSHLAVHRFSKYCPLDRFHGVLLSFCQTRPNCCFRGACFCFSHPLSWGMEDWHVHARGASVLLPCEPPCSASFWQDSASSASISLGASNS